MFGYVTANVDALSEDDLKAYRGIYCGLCRSLKERYGSLSRIMLTYDMTFLILVLSSLYDEQYSEENGRCIIHPKTEHLFSINTITQYATDMSIALVHNKFIDDWNDDKKLSAKLAAGITQKDYNKVCLKYPRQCGVIEKCLAELTKIEHEGVSVPDAPAGIFGELLAEIFIYEEDEYSDTLRQVGRLLGEFIYIMDAWDDLASDIKKEKYNPLTFMPSENVKPILTMLISDCAEKLFSLPLKQNINVIKNIIYSGVWMRYNLKENKDKKLYTEDTDK